jgi:hypothetical protein
VASVESIVAAMRYNQQNIAYNDLHKVCEYYFGKPRQTGSSHAVFKTRGRVTPASISRTTGVKPRRTKCVK